MTMTTASKRQRSLSDFWRVDATESRVLEMVSVLQGARNIIGLMGSDLAVRWASADLDKSAVSFQAKLVVLNYSHLRGHGAPFPGTAVDAVIGDAAHEGGHILWTKADPNLEAVLSVAVGHGGGLCKALLKAERLYDGGHQRLLQELKDYWNVLEDAYVDAKVAERWEVLGEYIKVALASYDRISGKVDWDAIGKNPKPSRREIRNLWLYTAVYGGKLPAKMSKAVSEAMEFLLQRTMDAIKSRRLEDRGLLAVAVTNYLWEHFPERDDPLPIKPPPGEPGKSGAPSPKQEEEKPAADDGDGEGEEQEEGGDDGAPHKPQGEAQEGTGGAEGAGGAEDGDQEADDAQAGHGEGEGKEGEGAEASEDDADGEGKEKAEDEDDGDGEEAQEPSDQEAKDSEAEQPTSSVGGTEAGTAKDLTLDGARDQEKMAVPEALMKAVEQAIRMELEDLSKLVAETLAMSPRQAATSAKKADWDPVAAHAVGERVKGQVAELRRAFDEQKRADTRYLRGQTRGRLDTHALAKVGAGNGSVRMRKEVLGRPDMAVALLLDVSGSMNAHMDIVQETAAVFAEGLANRPGIDFMGLTYTNGASGYGSATQLTRICDRRMPKLCLGNITQGGGTPSGEALAATKVFLERTPERDRLLLHFTDGEPNCRGLLVVKAVEACRKAGITVFALGLRGMERQLDFQYGRGNWQTIESVRELPKAVATLLKKLG